MDLYGLDECNLRRENNIGGRKGKALNACVVVLNIKRRGNDDEKCN